MKHCTNIIRIAVIAANLATIAPAFAQSATSSYHNGSASAMSTDGTTTDSSTGKSGTHRHNGSWDATAGQHSTSYDAAHNIPNEMPNSTPR